MARPRDSVQWTSIVLDEQLKARLWRSIDVKGPDDCWFWKAYCDPTGYGKMRVKSKILYAHRVMWALHNGAIKADLYIRHLCEGRYRPGNIECRRCCNPAHLASGTPAENVSDSKKAGRWQATRQAQKYSQDLRLTCVQLARKGWTQQKIGDFFGLRQPIVSKILLGKI